MRLFLRIVTTSFLWVTVWGLVASGIIQHPAFIALIAWYGGYLCSTIDESIERITA